MSLSGPTKLRLFGAGARGRVIADFIRWRFGGSFVLEGCYDDNPDAAAGLEAPLLGPVAHGIESMPASGAEAVIALGTYCSWRSCTVMFGLQQRGVTVASLMSPMAFISPSATIEPGALVLDGAFIGARARIGALLTANAATIVEHDTVLGMNVMLGSGAAIAGFARIADHCFVGTNATVLPDIKIGPGTLVGAGSVVTRDIPGGVIAFGSPACVRRTVREGDEVPTAAKLASIQE